MPKDWSKRVTELEQQVRITKKKAELQKLISKKKPKAPKKKAAKPKTLLLKASSKPHKPRPKAIEAAAGQFVLMLPNGTAVPVSLGRTSASAPKVIEPP
jgi:hypothetical protein